MSNLWQGCTLTVFSKSDTKIGTYAPSCYQQPLIENFLHQWHNIFSTIETNIKTINDKLSLREYLTNSCRQYRAELQVYITNIPSSSASNLSNYINLLEQCLSCLHLIEIFYIEENENATSQLTDWLQRNFDHLLLNYHHDIQVDSKYFWNLCYNLILQGKMIKCVNLLKQIPLLNKHQDILSSLTSLILNLPSLNVNYQQVTPSLLSDAFYQWKKKLKQCKYLISQANLQQELLILCELLDGNEQYLQTY